ncbi:hypothetical protein [Pedobacter glucosidilyticus]|uniref:hypothetical protein n=1 Tax=Pedobacter glucosidilyticus TaxID=1122941 RepID=UPI0004252AB5|nr:hypothetical protein [Pedobacter glucosidilyticus]
MGKRKFKLNAILFFIIILTPLWMYLTWVFWPKTKLVIAIVDKTVLNKKGQEHASLTWFLRYNKYSKTSEKLYTVGNDYFGFFPKPNQEYTLKGLERFDDKQLEQLADDSDLTYVTDTYGIYLKEWKELLASTERSKLIYGGLAKEDMAFLKKMKKRKKLVLTEFNTIGTPTPKYLRQAFEKEFQIQWTGWVGRYFDSLDTNKNKELPRWLIENYKNQNNQQWPYLKSGIAFVNESDKIVILENIEHLDAEVPYILTAKEDREKYNIPTTMKYPFWFDIVKTSRNNRIISFYDIKVNDKGRAILESNNIPPQFPAVIEHYRDDYKFFYFAGDFADNPIALNASSFKGIHFFRKLFYDRSIASERVSFFWEYYYPLINTIITDYQNDLKPKTTSH